MKMYGRMARNSERLKKKQQEQKTAKARMRALQAKRGGGIAGGSGVTAHSRYRIGGPLDQQRKARAKAKP
jgi:hypothetical protein